MGVLFLTMVGECQTVRDFLIPQTDSVLRAINTHPCRGERGSVLQHQH